MIRYNVDFSTVMFMASGVTTVAVLRVYFSFFADTQFF